MEELWWARPRPWPAKLSSTKTLNLTVMANWGAVVRGEPFGTTFPLDKRFGQVQWTNLTKQAGPVALAMSPLTTARAQLFSPLTMLLLLSSELFFHLFPHMNFSGSTKDNNNRQVTSNNPLIVTNQDRDWTVQLVQPSQLAIQKPLCISPNIYVHTWNPLVRCTEHNWV